MPWEHGLQEFKVMIKKDEIFKIGIFNKPHGVKGEVSFTFTDDIFDRVDCEYLVWIRQKKLVCLRMWKFIFQRNM